MQKVEFSNKYLSLQLDVNGLTTGFIDKGTGKNYCDRKKKAPFAYVRKGEQRYAASSIQRTANGIQVDFDRSDVRVEFTVAVKDQYFVFEVAKVSDPQIDELVFANIYLKLAGTFDEAFAGCALALNLQTDVPEMPGLNHRLRAIGCRLFGIVGAKAAVLGCQPAEMRALIKTVVKAADDLPHSPVGGPYALDTPMSKGSFVFDLGDIGEHNVDQWIEMMHSLGFTQIEFHGAEAKSFRFGDCEANPELHPRGWDSIKAVIDKLHAAGIAAVLHNYSFCIDKKCAWVTPKPDPRLAKDAAFTLAATIDAETDAIPVIESTEDMSAVLREYLPKLDILQNGVTLQIDDELVKYSGVDKRKPFGFCKCERGANGTQKSAHVKGAKVYHLKECFGLFIPDGESTLFTEVAERNAAFYNYCGFDMIYLDALDGEASVNGRRNGWHYGGKFAHELFKRLKKPALMEMATFHHHLWYVRSRVGAWDAPQRGFKRFIDCHVASNDRDRRMFMPGHLGWWYANQRMKWSRAEGWHDAGKLSVYSETQFTDDIEYLAGKALATDVCFSLGGIWPDYPKQNETIRKKVEIIGRYEQLRHAGKVPASIKAELRKPGVECILKPDSAGNWLFHPAEYIKAKVGVSPEGARVQTLNRFDRQPFRMRLEALPAAVAYDAPGTVCLTDYADIKEFTEHADSANVRSDLCLTSDRVKCGECSADFTALNCGKGRSGAWAMIGRKYIPLKSLAGTDALGVWIHGDGQREVLNFQLLCPEYASTSYTDRCVTIDFKGWKYFALVEPDTDHFAKYCWPYVSYKNSLMEFPDDPEEMEALVASSRHLYRAPYHIFSGHCAVDQIASFSLWYNNLPPGKSVQCSISPVRALPLKLINLRNPRVRVNGAEIVFPVEMEPGQYLEFNALDDCKLYRPTGELIRSIAPQGAHPELNSGKNLLVVAGDNVGEALAPRAQITVMATDAHALK